MENNEIRHKDIFVRPPQLDDMVMPPVEQIGPVRIAEEVSVTGAGESDSAQLAELVDFSRMNDIFESFLNALGIPAAIIDLEGKVLASSRWRRLCVEFHRKNPHTRKRCIESDTAIKSQTDEGRDNAFYLCENGLIDGASPIILDGRHVANMFIGQFFVDPPDMKFFGELAETCGFEREDYFRAISEVPIVAKDKVPFLLKMLASFANLLGNMSVTQRRILTAKKEAEAAKNELLSYKDKLENLVDERTAELTNKQESLKAAEEKSRLLLESAGDGIFGVDSLGKLNFINTSAEHLLGWTSDELIGKPVHDIIHHTRADGSPYPISECPMCTAHENGVVSHIDNEILWRKDGSFFDAEYTARPIYKDCELIGAVITFLDITRRRKMEAELRQHRDNLEKTVRSLNIAKEAAEAANRAKSEFLANMSHELRTPLNAIIGFSQVMTRSRSLPADQQENVNIIKRSGEHLLTLINQVLELSKIEAGRITLCITAFDLHRFLNDLENLFFMRVREKNLRLLFERAPDVPRFIRTDEVKLRQILINLLNNAVKFTNQGGIVVRVGCRSDLTTFEKLSNLVFEIEDTGAGIAPEELNTVFEAFVQTESGKHSQEGTGLGLPISRKFVRMMGGDITLRSELGKGSVFRFEIEAETADSADISVRPPAKRVVALSPGQPSFRILIADDKPDNRLLMVRLLTPLGFEVREAENGREAVEIWETFEPHLIWMDMRMPVMNGYEATKTIKKTIKGQAAVIIALTASAFEEERAVVLSAGCDDFVRKPCREEEIFEMMSKHLGVRYVCEEQEKSEVSGQRKEERKAITPESLAALPSELLAELEKASVEGDSDKISSVIANIRTSDASLADELDKLADDFEYDSILKLIEMTR